MSSHTGTTVSPDCDIKSKMMEPEDTSVARSKAPVAGTVSVPIFALNSRGSYYVPMTVDLSVISPFMSLYREENCPILHPVTISVNFQVLLQF